MNYGRTMSRGKGFLPVMSNYWIEMRVLDHNSTIFVWSIMIDGFSTAGLISAPLKVSPSRLRKPPPIAMPPFVVYFVPLLSASLACEPAPFRSYSVSTSPNNYIPTPYHHINFIITIIVLYGSGLIAWVVFPRPPRRARPRSTCPFIHRSPFQSWRVYHAVMGYHPTWGMSSNSALPPSSPYRDDIVSSQP